MSGVIAWLTGFLDGNTGKYMCRGTMYRGYMYQAGMCAGVGVRFPSRYQQIKGLSLSPIQLLGLQASRIMHGLDMTTRILKG